MRPIEIWGGIECTVNRVRDCWHDQIEISGHAERIDDLDLVASLGIRTLRYPVLWERVSPDSSAVRDWEWTDRRLQRLRDLSIRPVVGLVHHGSGPAYTNLLDDNFAPELARFASDVAARFPWVDQYTPVNEPLTTARFSALYGHWYPHHRNDRSFARALVNQVRGVALSMAAIRRINPAAALVQTEDLGFTFSNAHMAYQGLFDNERRWLTWDLLCGCVNRHHPLRAFLERSGISSSELDWFEANPCPPQVVGINHYVTSDRYLDQRLGLYPAGSHGGNAKERYADVDAVRALSRDYDGWRVIEEAAKRYALPIALTEVHIGCTREEQLRWFEEAVSAAQRAQRGGCDIRAVTGWALLGSHNWDKLLTRQDGRYEPGAFDVRASSPRPTALAEAIRHAVAVRGTETYPDRPWMSPGWWHRPSRILYGTNAPAENITIAPNSRRPLPSPVLICGGDGVLARAFRERCERRGLAYVALSRTDLETSDLAAVRVVCDEIQPWAIVNAAGYVAVDRAEQQPSQCFRDNLRGAETLAEAANARDIPYLTFSSDLVFDGLLERPFTESDLTAPLNVYGQSKVAAEAATLVYPKTLCIRTAAFFGAGNGSDFLSASLNTLRRGMKCVAITDVTVSPTYLPDLADASLDLLIDGYTGLLHLANRGAVTWANFLEQGARAAGVSTRMLERRYIAELALPARRPQYSALGSERVAIMPSLEDAIARFTDDTRRFENAACTG